MSLSSRRPRGPGRPGRQAHAVRAAAWAGAAAAAFGTVAGAAELYYQPIVTLSSAYNSNIDLDNPKTKAVGYFADAATNIGIATPQSDTLLQPRLLYNYYPTLANRNRLEGFLNMNSRYSWQRDKFNFYGFFDHRDDVNAEQPGATTNPVNPDVGNTSPTTGQVLVGTTRNYLILDPTYTHLLTPLSSIGFAGEYQRMDWSPANTTGHLNFDYYQGRLFYAKTIDLRSDFQIGAYGSRYQAAAIDSHSNSGGLQFNGGYNWTQVLRSTLTVQWQRTKFQENNVRVFDVTSNPWAATFTTVYKEQISSYSFSLGRTIYPSSAGGLYTTDQVRGQYDRDFTQRVHFTTALRFFRDRTTTGVVGDNTRDYATGTVRLQYMMTQYFFVAGTYGYTYQKYRVNPNSASGHVVSVAFGYRGLDRQTH
jgi:hypothetical protein